MCFAHSVVCRVHYLLRDIDALAQRSAMVARLADEHGLNLWRALGSIYTGWSRAENGAVREGAAMIRDGIARYRAGGSALSLPLYLASLASLEGTLGNQPEALKLLGEAQAASAAGNEHWMSAEIHRLICETMLARNRDRVGAEREFRVAIALAREHGAKLWELQAATSLARLLRDGSKANAAFDRLELRRPDRLDELDVVVETRSNAGGQLPAAELTELERQAEHLIKAYVGVTTPVRVVEPGTIERSEGKAKRVIDLRPKT